MNDEIRIGQLAIRFKLQDPGVSVFEFDVPAGAKVPIAHSHDAYEETIYGLAGTMTWTVDGRTVEVGAGDVLSIPRGVVHRFDNPHDEDASALGIVTPGILGLEYFREIADVVAAANGGTPDGATLGAVMLRHGLTPAP